MPPLTVRENQEEMHLPAEFFILAAIFFKRLKH